MALLPDPITRKEMYLNKAATGSGSVPSEPFTREEMYLEAIANGGGGLNSATKAALLQIAQKVAYIDDQGATYYQDLYDALYPPKTAVSISAVFTQGSTVVYDNASLDSLKTMLVVTATYDDSSTEVLQSTAYTLSGTLTPGTSTITVTYQSKTTTFTVTVTASSVTYTVTNDLSHCTNSNSASTATSGTSYTATITADSGYRITDADIVVRMSGNVLSGVVSSGVVTIATVTGDIRITATASAVGYTFYDSIMANSSYTYNAENSIFFPDYVAAGAVTSIDELQLEFEFQQLATHSSSTCIIGAKDVISASYIDGLQIMVKDANLFAYAHGVNTTTNSAAVFPLTLNDVVVVKYTNTGISPFNLAVGSTDYDVEFTKNPGNISRLGLSFCNTNGTPGIAVQNSRGKIGYVKIWDKNGTLLNHFVPAVRNADNFVGMYDADKDVFITATTNTRYAAGAWSV